MKNDNAAEKEYEAQQLGELLDEMKLEEQMTLAKAEAFDNLLAVFKTVALDDPKATVYVRALAVIMKQALEQQKKVFL